MEASQDDLNILGDISLDWFKWCSAQYKLANIVEQVKMFLAETALV